MDINKRFKLIKDVGEEILTEENLKKLLSKKQEFIAYDGFEPSGQMHIAQGILRAINVNKMINVGAKFKMLVADWHAWANNKLGGDLDKIKIAGRYMIEVWKAAGMKLDNVEFVWASDLVKDDKYWSIVMQVAINNSVKRIIRTSQIMGRKESDSLSAAQILYPCMQTADIFYLNVDVAQLGMDQRKVNVLAREIAPKLGFNKPIVVSHHMLQGLQEDLPKLEQDSLINLERKIEDYVKLLTKDNKNIKVQVLEKEILDNKLLSKKYFVDKTITAILHNIKLSVKILKDDKIKDLGNTPNDFKKRLIENLKGLNISLKNRVSNYAVERATAMKMSKSNPNSAIFMTDSEDEVKNKINKAYCPEGIVEENPLLEYCKYIIFEKFDEFVIERPEKWGGNLSFKSYRELEETFKEKKLHPMDLKQAVSSYINKLLDPIRKHFETDENAKRLLEQVKSFKITR